MGVSASQTTAVHEDPAWASHLCEVELSPTRLRFFLEDSPPKPTLHEGDFNNLLVIISHLMLSPLIHPISLSSPNDLNCSGRNSHFAATSTRWQKFGLPRPLHSLRNKASYKTLSSENAK